MADEVTTVAMSFALAGFANDALHIASSGSSLALTGVANAFVNASNLAPTTTGLAPAMIPSGSATVPQTTVNTLANILFSCIHSAGASSSSCQSLLGAASTPPSSDTASAMIAIAHSPASAVSTLFAQQSSMPPFSPYLTTAPDDFSLGVVFTGGGINLTNGMAVDAMGNVWSTNDSYYLTEISSAGIFLSGPNGYFSNAYTPGPIAIDLNDNVWIGNGTHTINGPGSLFELSSNGIVLSGTNGYGYGLLRTPEGLAIDASNNIWVTDTVSDNVVEFSNSGQVFSGAKGFTGGGISNPYQLTITPSGNVWITNSTAYSISELSNSGMPLTPSTGVAGVGFFGGTSLAIDHQNNVWAVTEGPGRAQVSKVSPDGVILSGSGYATTAMQGVNTAGETMAIDGDDNVWTPAGSSNVIELSNTGETLSGSNGYSGGIASYPQYLVIDGSGDVWVSSAIFTPSGKRGVPGVYTFLITELVGVAAPVVTPIAAGVKLNMLGARP
jgi:sugar lactone lactonase YvrE